MTFHSFLVFVHVVSAIAMGGGALLSFFGLLALRRAQRVEEVRTVLGLLKLSEPVAAAALMVTPVAGLIMTVNVWGWHNGWINVAIGSMAFLLLPAGAITGTRRNSIAKLVKKLPDGALPDNVMQHLHNPLFGTAGYVMVALVMGIEFLMTTRPALEGSLLAITVSVLIGIAASLPIWRGRGEKAAETTQA